MSSLDLTVLYAFRNREPDRVVQSVLSLRRHNQSSFEAMVVDYGSCPSVSFELETVCEKHQIQYLRMETEGWPWNKSHALNTGIQRIQTPWIVNVDIDIIFESGILDTALIVRKEDTILYCKPFWLSKGSQKRKGIMGDYNQVGGFQYYAKAAIESITGFDERFMFWGAEDVDCHRRLLAAGYKTLWMDEERICHVWHPINYGEANPAPENAQVDNTIFLLQNEAFPPQQCNWGCAVETRDRLWLETTKQVEPESFYIDSGRLRERWKELLGVLKSKNPILVHLGPRFIAPRSQSWFARPGVRNFLTKFFGKFGLLVKPQRNNNADLLYYLFRSYVESKKGDWFWSEDYTTVGLVLV